MTLPYETAPYYHPIYLWVMVVLTLAMQSNMAGKRAGQLIGKQHSCFGAVLLSVLFVVLIGLRPISGRYFCDTANYAPMFYGCLDTPPPMPGDKEWCFNLMMWCFAQTFGDASVFFLAVAAVYQGALFRACRKWCPNNTAAAVLFAMGAFSFFSYATNGIRNGMACHLILLSMAFLWDKTSRGYIIAGLLAFLAYNIHHSTALPILCMVVAFVYKKPKVIFAFWVFSILLSLVAGGAITNFFASLGFDDRVASYGQAAAEGDGFSHTGFRWDFLLYSAMPIWLGYEVLIRRRLWDERFVFLFSTYILCNSFWIMVIRASFSNRFAYLSWFMYPLVIAYPCLCMNVWGKRQGRVAGNILLAHTGFTFLMTYLYYGMIR